MNSRPASRHLFNLASLSLLLATSSASAATIYVNGAVPASGSGTSWGSPFKTIPEAVSSATAGDQIWVRAGQYDQSATITAPSNVGIYGGFAGSEVTLLERNAAANPTIVRRYAAGSFPVVTLSSASGVTLDGLTITGGSSTNGGGISSTNSGASNTIRRCTIAGNAATNGAGIYLSNSSPVIINCTISGNVATAGGGGVYAVSGSASVLTNTILAGNRAANGGGAHCEATSPTFLNCTISANSSNANGGGGLYARAGAAPLVKNTLFSYNGNYAIAEADVASAPVCVNCDLYKNVSRPYLRDGVTAVKNAAKLNQLPGNGGNITNGAPTYVMEGAARIGGNFTAAGAWSAVDQKTTLTVGTALLTPGSLVGRTIAFGTGRSPRRQGLILANTTNRIVVEDLNGTLATLATNNSQYVISDYHLQAGSGAINKGTNTGAPATDIDGDARPQGPSVDIGVDELLVLPPNQAPVNTVPGTQNIAEDTNLVFSLLNGNAIVVSDPDAGTNAVRVTLTATNAVLSLSTTASLSFITGDGSQDATMAFAGTIANVNAALNGLLFDPNANFNGAASLVITTNDQGNTGSGGALSDTDNIVINVGALNDAPVNTVPGVQSIPENIGLIFSGETGNAISIADVDAGNNQVSTTLTALSGKLTLAATSGLSFSQGTGTNDFVVSFQGTLVNINAALQGLIFTPDTGFNGAAGLTITTRDNGFSGLGGALTDSDSVVINVTPITNVPQIANLAVTQNVTEGGLAIASGQIADLDSDETYQVTINWGDGSSASVLNLPAGSTSFNTSHTYTDDDPSGTPSDQYTVTVDVTDAGSQTDNASVPTTVLNADPVVTLVTVTPTLNEGTTATATVSFTDAGSADTHTATVDWGDGIVDTINLPAGQLALVASHQYIDDGISLTPADDYGVQVVISDDDLGDGAGVSTTTVTNVGPSLSSLVLAGAAGVDVNTTLTGSIVDPGSADSFLVTIDWDDNTIDEIPLDPGQTDFEIVNNWASNGTYNVLVTVEDDDGATTQATRSITISNNLITLTQLAATSANESSSVTLSGVIGDSNPDATFTVTVDWNDGAPQIVNLPAGTVAFSVDHFYSDDNPSGTPADVKNISVQVVDSDARNANGSVNTTISNVAPQLSSVAFAGGIQTGDFATLAGNIADASALDSFVLEINWADGSATETVPLVAGCTSFNVQHSYATSGNFQAVVVLTDDDTGAASAQASINVTDPAGTLVLSGVAITGPVDEGSSATLTGNIIPSSPTATMNLDVNWGDGGTTQSYAVAAGSTSFSVDHQYSDDNPTATPSDVQQVSVFLTDSNSQQQSASTQTTVNNLAPQLSGVAFAGGIVDGGTASLIGNIADASPQDSFVLEINWADGSATQTVPLAAGATGFNVQHVYAVAGDYDAVVTLTDDDTGEASAQASITVTDDGIDALVLSSVAVTSPVNEGSTATLTGNIAPSSPGATMTLDVNWGDGGTTQAYPIAAGSSSFSVDHQYIDDNPTATASDVKSVSVFVSDSNLRSQAASAQVTINNVAPQVNSVAFAGSILENGTATLNGNIVDPGTQDSFTLLVNWGDGATTESIPVVAGATSFSRTHQYLQNGSFLANVVLTDDDGASTTTQASATVTNVAPTLTSLVVSSPVNIGQQTNISANIVDAGTLDTFQISINWGDGSGVQVVNRPAGSTSFNASHTYASPGTYPVSVTVLDSDGGSNSYNATAVVDALADVSVTKGAAANTQPNGTLVYTVVVTNNGPNTAHNVVLDDPLPASVSLTTATATAGTVSFAAGNVHAEFGDLTNGQSRTVTIVTSVSGSATGTITNTAGVVADETDANTTNNTASANTTVLTPSVNADLQLDVSAPSAGAQGLPLTYTITVFNAGPVTATNVVVTDVLPTSVEFISATPDANTTITGGLFEGGVVTANFPSIASGAGAAVTITVRPFVVGALTNSATVAGNQFDPSLANNTDSAASNIAARQAADFRGQYIKLPIAKCTVKNGITKCAVKGQLAITNPGLVTSQTVIVSTLLSNDGVPDAGDVVLRTSLLKPIKLGKTKKLKISVKLPFNTATSGKFLLVRIDSADQVQNEIRERNNLVQFGPFQ